MIKKQLSEIMQAVSELIQQAHDLGFNLSDPSVYQQGYNEGVDVGYIKGYNQSIEDRAVKEKVHGKKYTVPTLSE